MKCWSSWQSASDFVNVTDYIDCFHRQNSHKSNSGIKFENHMIHKLRHAKRKRNRKMRKFFLIKTVSFFLSLIRNLFNTSSYNHYLIANLIIIYIHQWLVIAFFETITSLSLWDMNQHLLLMKFWDNCAQSSIMSFFSESSSQWEYFQICCFVGCQQFSINQKTENSWNNPSNCDSSFTFWRYCVFCQYRVSNPHLLSARIVFSVQPWLDNGLKNEINICETYWESKN
jgi:hypothetical protein